MNIQKKTKITVEFLTADWQKIIDLRNLLNHLDEDLYVDSNCCNGIEEKAVTYINFYEDEESQKNIKKYLARIRRDLNEITDAWIK